MKRNIYISIIFLVLMGVIGCGKKNDIDSVDYIEETDISISDDEKNQVNEEEIKVSFDTETVMSLPGKITVSHAGEQIIARVNYVSWAYAVNDLEWSSVNEKNDESIDGPYEDRLEVAEDTTDFLLTFDSIAGPDAIVYVYRYPLENWADNSDEEDGTNLREALEHWDDYDEYEEMNVQKIDDTSYVIVTPGGDAGGYIYEIKAAWDTELYRGSCIYSFMAWNLEENNITEE